MLTETGFRREALRICSSSQNGISKARQCLKLASKAKDKASSLAHLAFQYHHQGDERRSKQFASAAAQLIEIVEWIRAEAKAALNSTTHALQFEKQTPIQGYPNWKPLGSVQEWRPGETTR
jgi:hypothetical protein